MNEGFLRNVVKPKFPSYARRHYPHYRHSFRIPLRLWDLIDLDMWICIPSGASKINALANEAAEDTMK